MPGKPKLLVRLAEQIQPQLEAGTEGVVLDAALAREVYAYIAAQRVRAKRAGEASRGGKPLSTEPKLVRHRERMRKHRAKIGRGE